jgi:2-polyprenyl-3-methyl-5-hydroxy-6-metoxy-1,4-benzoquinol methylase
MQYRHTDRKVYYQEQVSTTKKFVIPYIEEVKKVSKESVILEVGCGEGGNLQPFVKMGCQCYGIDIDTFRINIGREIFAQCSGDNIPVLIDNDIYRINPEELPKFDLIFLRDVIEHIPYQKKFMGFIRKFLKEDGVIFFAFPPWRMPFGGHQQVLKHRFLSKLPYYHTLPNCLYKAVLRLGKVPESAIKGMLNVKSTGISIHRFLKILKQEHYQILKKTDWFINPNYETKFGLKPRKLFILNKIPYFRDFFTTCFYCVVKTK